MNSKLLNIPLVIFITATMPQQLYTAANDQPDVPSDPYSHYYHVEAPVANDTWPHPTYSPYCMTPTPAHGYSYSGMTGPSGFPFHSSHVDTLAAHDTWPHSTYSPNGMTYTSSLYNLIPIPDDAHSSYSITYPTVFPYLGHGPQPFIDVTTEPLNIECIDFYEKKIQSFSQAKLDNLLDNLLKEEIATWSSPNYARPEQRPKIAALIRRGAGPEAKRSDALSLAVNRSDSYLVEFLLQQGVIFKVGSGGFGFCKTTSIAKLLFDYKICNVHEKDEFRDTFLHKVMKNNEQNETLVKFLIESGADVNATNRDGFTPLMELANYHQFGCVHVGRPQGPIIDLTLKKMLILLQAGADLYCKTTSPRFKEYAHRNALEIAYLNKKSCIVRNAIIDFLEKEFDKQELLCLVCFENMPMKEFSRLDCGHRSTCNNCMKEVINHALQSHSSQDMRCTSPNCSSPALSDANIVSIMDDREIVDKIRDIKLQEWLNAQSNLVRCPTPDCTVAVIDEASCPYTISCACGVSICSKCRFNHSHRIGCEEAEEVRRLTADPNSANSLSEEYIKQSKKCPRCKAPVEKIDGCNHMTCNSCKYEYCWLCDALYQPSQLLNGRMGCGCLHWPDGALFH